MRRREWMKIAGAGTIGATAYLAGARPPRARALGPGPKKLLVLYVPGGWMPELFFSPLSADEVRRFHPHDDAGVPELFDASELGNLDGTGDATNDDGTPRLRAPRTWLGPRPHGRPVWSLGRAWDEQRVYDDALVIHGVDHETASHESGQIAAMSGVPNGVFIAPSLPAWAASNAASTFPDRILASVQIGSAPTPASLALPAVASPVQLGGVGDLELRFSDRRDDVWGGLRARPDTDVSAWDGSSTSAVPLTAMDAHAMRRALARRGGTASQDRILEDLYDGLASASRSIAANVVARLEATPGWEGPIASYAFHSDGPYSFGGADIASGATHGDEWGPQLDLALRLLKSDLSTAITARVAGIDDIYLDTHSYNGYRAQFLHTRTIFEVIGRFLGEMKRTPRPGGQTLLDETLVIVTSEFARTWPRSGMCDHWPTNSVLLAGGGIRKNRALGGFDLAAISETSNGPIGVPMQGRVEGADSIALRPRARDVVYTMLAAMGLDAGVFIPNGPVILDGVIA